MLAYGLTEHQLTHAADITGVRVRDFRPVGDSGRAVRFRLALAPDKLYQRRAPITRRRVPAVCWHGHEAFFRALFAVAPGARVQTAFLRGNPPGDRFYTAENFDRLYLSTGNRNVGSQFQPCLMRAACECW
jgi:hypothetical protein